MSRSRERLEFLPERCDLVLQSAQARLDVCARRLCRVRRLHVATAEELRVALLLLPRTAGQPRDELALDQALQCLVNLGERGEGMEALGSPLQLARGLRPPQHENRQRRRFALVEAEGLVE